MGNSLQPNREITQNHTPPPPLELSQQQQKQEFTCEICIEPTSATQKFVNNNFCTHPFCLPCVSKYIELKILDTTAKIPCPALNCDHDLDPVSNMSLIPAPLFTKWCDLLCEDSVLGLDKSYCPNRECMSMLVNECGGGGGAGVKKVTCPNCKKVFCFKCKREWHAGFKCEESELMMSDRNDVVFGTLIETNKWQRCPVCGHCVELRFGCKYVKCRCKTEFCYNCGKKTSQHKHDCDNPLPRATVVRQRLTYAALILGWMLISIFAYYLLFRFAKFHGPNE